ncbi:FAD-dependent oxidoreductase [Nocardia rhamnosiphila]|uniref:FAD-dependent monooxygenase n=1 Tax=Nocardia rhamnosiphila TaxID=426716 RepID=A0ABV2X0L9_9NOCA
MNPVQDARSPRGTALVIGGSIAGCATAAALREHYERVIIVDRDELPTERKERKGAPHAYQFHALTSGGRQAFEDLLPGLTERALAGGVPGHDPGRTRYCSKAGFLYPLETDLLVLLSSRINLEAILRGLAREVSGIEMLERTTATGLRIEDGAVTGVEVADITSGTTRTIDADFVVDASGRSSVASDWLEAAGYTRPVEQVVNAKWGYVTTYVRPGPNWSPDYKVLYFSPLLKGDGPKATRGGGMWSQEDGLWVVTAQGCAQDYPPADEAGFREYLNSFGRPEFQELLSEGEIVRPPVAWRNTTNLLRDYASLPVRPERFVVIGDATAAFNPVYGQGMSAAALAARLLRDELREAFRGGDDLAGFAERFQKQLDATVIQGCWNLSAGSDFNVPGVEVNGLPYGAEQTQEQLFVNRVVSLATEDADVARKLVETIQMIRGLEWLADEDLRAKVLADWDRLGELVRIDEIEGAA